jgi:exopolysaccharide production protein ExoZ
MTAAAAGDALRPAIEGRKLISIQYLRAFAAIAVVVSHASNSLLGHAGHLLDFDLGAYGVDVFFVLSGFIMFYTSFDVGMRPGAFLLKRLIRIVPLYFILSTAMFVMVVLLPQSFNRESPDLSAYLQSIFFIPHWNPRSHDLEPLIGQGWTLNYEMFFYALFALSLFIRHRFCGFAVLPVIAALVGLGQLHPVETPVFLTYTDPLMLEFCVGIVVAAAFKSANPQSLRWPALLFASLAVVTVSLYAFHADWHGLPPLRPLMIGFPCSLLVTAAVGLERGGRLPTWSSLILLGDASYSLYLVHGFIMGFGQRLWHRFFVIGSVYSHAAYIVFILVVSVAVSIPIYRYAEVWTGRRLTAALERLRGRRRQSAVATHAAK